MNLLGLVDIPWWLLILLIMVTLYLYATWPYRFDYLERQGIRGPHPYPFIGTMYRLRMGFIESNKELLRDYGKLSRTFQGRTPTLTVADVDLMKEIFVKEFKSFFVRSNMQRHLYPDRCMVSNVADYDHWKHVRDILSPTFSGGKLKIMMPKINRCAGVQTQHLVDSGCSQQSIDMKQYIGCFTMDVIAATAFGLEIDSRKEDDTPFITNAKKVFDMANQFKPSKFLIIMAIFFAPDVLKWFSKITKMSLFPDETIQFFADIVRRTIEQRKEAGVTQADLLQLMINVKVDDPPKKGGQGSTDYEYGPEGTWSKTGLLEEEILGNAFVSILAGYDTVATSLTFILYNLALNPECQEKLYQEIVQIVGDEDDIKYDKLSELQYAEMCIEESLRIYPPVIMNFRVCQEDITLKGITKKKKVPTATLR